MPLVNPFGSSSTQPRSTGELVNPFATGGVSRYRRRESIAPQVEEEGGLFDALVGGVKTTGAHLGATVDVLQDDRAELAETAAAPDVSTEAQQRFRQGISTRATEDDSLWDGISNVAASVWENPQGALHEVVAQFPNAGAVLGGAAVGAKLGAPGGPLGVATGAILGMFVGNFGIETGAKALERTRKGEALEGVVEEGALKAAGVTGIDALTFGITRALAGIPGRAVESTIKRSLVDKGVDVTDEVAVKAALESAEFLQDVAQKSARALADATTGGQIAARGAARFGLETGGEGLGEYTGERLAGNEPSMTEVALEGMLGAPQSAIEMAIGSQTQPPRPLQQMVDDAQRPIDVGVERDLIAERQKVVFDNEGLPVLEDTIPVREQGIMTPKPPSRMNQQELAQAVIGARQIAQNEAIPQEMRTRAQQGIPILEAELTARMRPDDKFAFHLESAAEQTDLAGVQEQLTQAIETPIGESELDYRAEQPRQLPSPPIYAESPESQMQRERQEQALQDIQDRATRQLPPPPLYAESPEAQMRRENQEQLARRVEAGRQRVAQEQAQTQRVEGFQALEQAQAQKKQADIEAAYREPSEIEALAGAAKEKRPSLQRRAQELRIRRERKEQIDARRPKAERGRDIARIKRSQVFDEIEARQEPQLEGPMQAAARKVSLAEKIKAKKAEVQEQADAAATSTKNDLTQPTEAQKKAGNYKKGHVSLHGMGLSIENPRGSERSGVDPGGQPWSIKMKHHYGYIKGTKGKDKDHLDIFLGPNAEDPKTQAFVVDQIDPRTGDFDEHKILLGFADEATAEAGYKANYAKGWAGLGAITPMSVDELKAWIEGDTTKALKYKKPPGKKAPKAASPKEPEAAPEPEAVAEPTPPTEVAPEPIPAPTSPVEEDLTAIKIPMEAEISETGQTRTYYVPADQALEEATGRIEAYQRLLDCVRK